MMLDLPYLLNKYNLKPKGVLHIGASEGQEVKTYQELGIKKMFLIEAIPGVYKTLRENIQGIDGAFAFLFCISDETGKEIEFNIANNGGQSSSMLEFGTHTAIHPEVRFVDKIKLITARIDDIFPGYNFDGWMLNIDLQGAELKALKGIGSLLDKFSCCLMEINKAYVYKSCALVDEVDDYMRQFLFTRVETGKWVGDSWTDGFYLKYRG